MLLDVLARGRQREEATMLDTYDVMELDGTKTDGGIVSDNYTKVETTIGKTGGNTATGQDAVTRTVNVGDVPTEVIRGGLAIPVSAALPDTGWIYKCTASSGDPTNVGRCWRTENIPSTTIATCRRLDVVEVPPEVLL